MARRILMLSPLLLAAWMVAWAADPWDALSPAEWSKKDVDKILRSSPWSKTISTPTTWARTGGEKFGIGPGKTTIGLSGRRTATSGGTDDPDDPQNYNGYFILRWANAKVVRQAKARGSELSGKPLSKKEEAEPPADQYELELVWDVFARFPAATEVEAARNSFIKPSRIGVEFNPTRVEYRHGPATSIATVVFYFSKKTAAGKPILQPGEDKVEFVWRVGPSSIGAKFDPRRMKVREDADY